MNTKRFFWYVKFGWNVMLILLCACVEPINFDVPPAQFQMVVEGMITDGPGPYTVKVSNGLNVDADSSYHAPVQDAKIKLYDDEGNNEDFTETSAGVYMTGGAIQGKVGHAYHIKLETNDGKIFESEPDMINQVGEVENIRHEFEARSVEETYGQMAANVFNIYVDARAAEGEGNYVRWRFKGTYRVFTYPEQHWIWSLGYVLQDPYPCSGYAFTGFTYAVKVAECTCCTCWANHYETEPQLSDGQLITNNEYRNIKVAEVPINGATFYDKYMVEVEQMSLTKNAFDFFKLIRTQKQNASSLFQPPSGEIRGNVKAMNSTDPVVGIFWASSVKSKTIFIQRDDVPYIIRPIDPVREKCTWYPNSSTQQPENWE